MANEFDSFPCKVWPHGYEWIKLPYLPPNVMSAIPNYERTDWQPQDWVLRRRAGTGQQAQRRYEPLQEATGLFLEFASLDPADLAALNRFADQYGLLRSRRVWCTIPKHGDKPSRNPRHYDIGEPLKNWATEIAEMKRTLEIWRTLEANDTVGLDQFFVRDDESDWWTLRGQRVQLPITLPHDEESGIDLFRGDTWRDDPTWREDIGRVARSAVQHSINRNLRQEVVASLLVERKTGRMRIRHCPLGLLGAMWLQFARMIEGNLTFRACKLCGRHFEVSTSDTGTRVDREFCSDACKSRDYRQRKAKVLELRAAGKTPGAIAKETNTNLETVRTWISSNRKRGDK